jgi:excinuclease ABC subunit C
MEKNAVVLQDGTDADIFALTGDELEAAVQVFHVRGGRIRGQRGWVVEKVEDLTDADLVEHLLQQVYGTADEAAGGDVKAARDSGLVPREVLVPVLPAHLEEMATWLSGLRGARVDIRVPQRGDKRELAATVLKNAEHALALHRTRRAGDLTNRSLALREIQEALDLDSAPLRIECYDISTTMGTHQAASMVVFEDGLARKSEYRTFGVKGPDGEGARDDTAAMYEVITRRFRRYLAERSDSADLEIETFGGEVDAETPATDRKRFAYPPNLVVVDGGPPQVAAAAKALADLGIDDVALCGLAKRLEEVWVPGEEYPVILQRSSEGLYLLQRVRDEAHRFAITAHRKKRGKGMTVSELDSVPGLGPARKGALLRHFGSLKRLRAASAEEIATVQGMGQRTAEAVVAALHPAGSPAEEGSATDTVESAAVPSAEQSEIGGPAAADAPEGGASASAGSPALSPEAPSPAPVETSDARA